jgi:hypothetical protein
MLGMRSTKTSVADETSMNPGKDEPKSFFAPRSIAIVGVTRKEYALGGISFLLKLQEAEFSGGFYPIHPETGEIRGIEAYPGLGAPARSAEPREASS